VLYRPGTAAYSLQRRDSLVLELPDAPPQAQIFERTAYVRVALAEDAGRLRATITLDSIRAATPGLVPPDSLRVADGTVWTGDVTTKGLSELSANRVTGVGDQLVGALHALFPALLPGGAREGAKWQDTSTVSVRLSAFSMTEKAITTYQAVGQETRDGHRALRLESTATLESSGSGQQFGQAIEINASGTRRGMHLLGTDGVLVAAEGSDSTDMTLSVPAVGQSVPAKQHSTLRITLLSKAAR
jgi:hypothetical protein